MTTKIKYTSLAEVQARDPAAYAGLRLWLNALTLIEAKPLLPTQDVGEQLDARKWQARTLLGLVRELVPTVSIPVADGYAVYIVLSRNDGWMVFQWVYGGFDNYVSPFGQLVAVPLETGRYLIGEVEDGD